MIRVTPELCKKCALYSPEEKTCTKSVVAVSKEKVFHAYAKSVRLDPKRCGPDGAWFESK